MNLKDLYFYLQKVQLQYRQLQRLSMADVTASLVMSGYSYNYTKRAKAKRGYSPKRPSRTHIQIPRSPSRPPRASIVI